MATTAVDSVFLDTNVLMYSELTASPFNAQAATKLAAVRAAGHELWISRQVVREDLAAMSRPGTITGLAPMSALANDVRRFIATYRMAEDGPSATAQLLALLTAIPAAGKQVHDTNIVATMLAHAVPRLLTHNVADFNRFAGLISIEPLVP
jgi:predicted nucleic acid-binding protein